MTRDHKGFTLLEVMIAMAILSGALTWISVGISRNIKAENHAKLMATATFLARGKIIEFEDELYEKGFGEFEKEVNGVFDDRGFSRFSWRILVDKVELPSQEQMQNVLSKATEAKQSLAGGDTSTQNQLMAGAGGPGGASSPFGQGAGILAGQFGIIKTVLEDGIRRVTVRIEWTEGRTPQNVEVVSYYTDPRRVDQAIQMNAGAAAGAAGGGTPGSSSSSSGGTGGKTPTPTPTH